MDTKLPLGTQAQLKQPYVSMRNRNKVHFLNPTLAEIKIDDVAWHLARQCRFTCHVKNWYSTAEHSILGARQAKNTQIAREFLVHDAGEFVFGDLSSPIKRLCPDYKEMSDRFQDFCFRAFLGYIPEEGPLKEIDSRLCATEMRVLRGSPDESLEAEPYTDVHFYNWRWQDAHVRFLDMFTHLFPEYKDVEGVLGNGTLE